MTDTTTTQEPTYEQLDEANRRIADVLVHTLYVLEGLKQKGLVEGPDMLTPEGYERGKALEAAGFTPTEEELRDVLAYLAAPPVNTYDHSGGMEN